MQHNNKIKNIKHLLTLLALVALGQTAWAQEVHVSNESDLCTAIQNQPAGTTIIVDVNFSTGMDELVFNKGFILDLNGKTITANNHFRVTDNWTLQIYDNSTAGTGTINGGYVEAHGGKYGAGIGGGQDASGATVTVTGGTVNAYGGTDAAGIGSGEEVTAGAGTINGGTLTVTGGYVFADGTGWGAGIGGGEDADGANVTINGGTVLAKAGSSAGNKNGSAIGSEMGDGHRGSLTIGDNIMVHAGQDASHLSSFTAAERVPACYFRPYARIEPCNHDGATYTINGNDANGTHTLHCGHCSYSPTHTHIFDETGTCTVCGVSGTVYTVDVYLPVAGEGSNN